VPIPPFLPQAAHATISDNYAVLLLAKYSSERPSFTRLRTNTVQAPSDRQTGLPISVANFLCEGLRRVQQQDIVNTAFAATVFGNKTSRSCGPA